MESVLLIGSHDVASGGNAMREAARQMEAAAASIQWSVEMLSRHLTTFATEMRDLLEEDRKQRSAWEARKEKE